MICYFIIKNSNNAQIIENNLLTLRINSLEDAFALNKIFLFK